MTVALHDVASANGAGGHVNGGAPTLRERMSAPEMRAALAEPGLRETVRRQVENTERSLRAIADEFLFPRSSFDRFVAEQDWPRPDGAPVAQGGSRAGERRLAATLDDAGAVMARIVRAADRQVRRIDLRLRKPGAEAEEKDARILGHLARTIKTLTAPDRGEGATAREPEPVDRAELNARLVRRIRQWAEDRGRSE
jgi:hypothetical protein